MLLNNLIKLYNHYGNELNKCTLTKIYRNFSENFPFMFADDLKILHIGTPADQVQSNLDALEDRVTQNKMGLAIEKCPKLLFKGPERHFYLCGSLLQTSAGVEDLGSWIQLDLTWKIHSEERMKKPNRVFYSLRRNVAFKVKMRIKLGL